MTKILLNKFINNQFNLIEFKELCEIVNSIDDEKLFEVLSELWNDYISDFDVLNPD